MWQGGHSEDREQEGIQFLSTKKDEGQPSDIEEEGKEESEESYSDIKGSSQGSDNDFSSCGCFLATWYCVPIQDETAVPKGWKLLDSQSMVDVFSNEKLLMNIHDVNQSLVLICNACKLQGSCY